MNRAERRRNKKRRRGSNADRGDVGGLFDKAVAHWNSARYEPARRLCSQILAAQPEHAGAINLEGILLVEGARYPEAADRFARAVAIDPDNASFRMNFADALQLANRCGDAEREYETILQNDRGHSGLHLR